MVSFVGALPKGANKNGLEDHSRMLAEALVKGDKFYVVGVVSTDSVVTKGTDLVPVPKVRFERVELVLPDSPLELDAVRLLERAGGERQNGVGQPQLALVEEDEA